MIRMRRINLNQDCRFLFNLINASAENVMPSQTQNLNADEFYHWLTGQLNGYYHDFFIFENSELDSEICGFALSYDYRVYDGHCHIYFHFFKDMDPSIVRTFIVYLFQEYPLIKAFFETVSTDRNKISLVKELGFQPEMCLKEYKYQNGNYEDWYVLSIYPECIEDKNNE